MKKYAAKIDIVNHQCHGMAWHLIQHGGVALAGVNKRMLA